MRKHGRHAKRLRILQQVHAASAILQGQRQAVAKRHQIAKERLRAALEIAGIGREEALEALLHERQTGRFPLAFLEKLTAALPLLAP